MLASINAAVYVCRGVRWIDDIITSTLNSTTGSAGGRGVLVRACVPSYLLFSRATVVGAAVPLSNRRPEIILARSVHACARASSFWACVTCCSCLPTHHFLFNFGIMACSEREMRRRRSNLELTVVSINAMVRSCYQQLKRTLIGYPALYTTKGRRSPQCRCVCVCVCVRGACVRA